MWEKRQAREQFTDCSFVSHICHRSIVNIPISQADDLTSHTIGQKQACKQILNDAIQVCIRQFQAVEIRTSTAGHSLFVVA